MAKSKRFQYYQPNAKDPKDKFGDCQIRALSKALNCTWLEAFDALVPLMREEQCNGIGVTVEVSSRMLGHFGFVYHGITNAKGTKRPTVDSFAKEHPVGTYILRVANHVVAVVDGKYYDTWDSGGCCLYGYYEKNAEEVDA